MGMRDLVDRARKAAAFLASQLGASVRRGGAPGPGLPPDFHRQTSGPSGEHETAENPDESAFPGFEPPPGPGDRFRALGEALVERARNNPRALWIAAGGLLALALVLLTVSLALRPPRPVAPSFSASQEALEILRRIPVPREDPLSAETALDRPRKDRYTEEDIARTWLDLGRLPMEELRERNRAELRNLLSAMERP